MLAIHPVRVVQLEEAWTVNRAVPQLCQIDKEPVTLKLLFFFGLRPKLEAPCSTSEHFIDPPLLFAHRASVKAAWCC